jgi:hypothetical protein
LNEESLKKKIEDLFDQRNLHLEGKISSENEFTAYDKWIVVGWDIPNLKRKAAYLYGILTNRGTVTNVFSMNNIYTEINAMHLQKNS